MKRFFVLFIGLMMLSRLSAGELPVIYVSILPQLEAVQKIGGGICRAEALLRYGQSPETFQLNARLMEDLRQAEGYIGIGLPFEKIVLPKIHSIYPKMLLADASRKMQFYNMGAEQNGAAHDHRFGSDPHVWLSVENMLVHSRTVEEMLCCRFPGSRAHIQKNGASYRAELRGLKSRMAKKLEPFRGRDILVFHPAFGYFLREYGLVQRAVEKDGKAPGGRYLDLLIRDIQARKINTLFYQPQFSDRIPRNLSRRLRLNLRTLDPLPVHYSSGMLQMAEKIAEACADQKKNGGK